MTIMIFKVFKSIFLLFLGVLTLNAQQKEINFSEFKNPAAQYRPMPLWFINGTLTDEGIFQQLSDSKKAGFSGVAVLPMGKTLPTYLSDDYFEKYGVILSKAKKLEMNVIMYDDTDFPSGSAGGMIEKDYPQFLRKSLEKTEINVSGLYKGMVPQGKLMAAVAMEMTTKERIDLKPFIVNNLLSWRTPSEGDWRIMFFNCNTASFWKPNMPIDAMDPEAMDQFIKLTYDKYATHFSTYFTNTIQLTFFDDVGFLRKERTWTGLFNEKFKSLNGYNPDLFYPALWYDIGPETQVARVALFNTRSELLSEGYPKAVAEWAIKHGLKSTGHPPGNYRIQPVDMHGDIFKFFRYTSLPLVDVIIDYKHGRDGYKLISSTADLYDRPVVSTEVYGAFKENIVDVNMLYRTIMELFVRGVNFVVPHAEWYNPDKIGISPLISPYSKKLEPALPAYSTYVGRSCYLLQGGRKISEIGIVYPISSLQAGYYFDAPENKRAGTFVYPEADYLDISGLLSNEIRRDFTFIHPEYLATDKYQISAGNLHLNNTEAYQDYKTLIIPGGSVIALNTLEKIKKFYDEGGKVIATSLLPSQSTKVAEDDKITALVNEMFGKDAVNNASIQTNAKGGKAYFVKNPTKDNLQKTLDNLTDNADVIFENLGNTKSELGVFSYLHKVKDAKDIYLFANSSDDIIDTNVMVRGKHKLEVWNPHKGIIDKNIESSYLEKDGVTYTKFHLQLLPVESVFFVSKESI